MTEAAKKIKTTAAVFELPQKLGVLQHIGVRAASAGVVYQVTDASTRGF
jgi:hypothetical protein